MSNIPADPVIGYSGLSEVLGVSVQALAMRKSRGNLGLEPVAVLGRTAIYDRAQVEALKEQAAQERQ